MPEIAQASETYAGGGYSEMTIQRWRKMWNQRRDAHEGRVWASLFHCGLDAELPRERRGGWHSLFAAWDAHSGGGSLFVYLLKLDRSPVAATGKSIPQKLAVAGGRGLPDSTLAGGPTFMTTSRHDEQIAAARQYELPGSRRQTVSVRTLERYLQAYRTGDWESLKPRPKDAKGRSKLDAAVLQQAIRLRMERPARSMEYGRT